MLSILNLTFLLLLTDIVKGGLPPIQDCGNNEVYTCGSPCIETCDYKPKRCIKLCRFGCFCQANYVRQSNDTKSPCVKREDCKKLSDTPRCGENEEYQQCGSACPPTCDDFSYPLPKEPKACTVMCKSDCFCKQGFYRATNGQCVKAEECCTGNNERYIDCGSACVDTCDYASQWCTNQCVAGCFCTSNDYVRQNNNSGSVCIKREQCLK